MNDQQRQAILALIKERLATDPNFHLSQLTPYLWENGFPPEIRQGVNAKLWLLANFPELGIRFENGKEFIQLEGATK